MTAKKPSPDPQSCGSCRCWVADPGAPVGLCKRLPPVVLVVADEIVSAFPTTSRIDICGEFAIRYNA
jgi:hypothetical protein